jgi:hypothetical protein
MSEGAFKERPIPGNSKKESGLPSFAEKRESETVERAIQILRGTDGSSDILHYLNELPPLVVSQITNSESFKGVVKEKFQSYLKSWMGSVRGECGHLMYLADMCGISRDEFRKILNVFTAPIDGEGLDVGRMNTMRHNLRRSVSEEIVTSPYYKKQVSAKVGNKSINKNVD